VSAVRVIVRQLEAPGWVCVQVDDPRRCDRCEHFAYVVWRHQGQVVCPYCIRAEDFERAD